MPVGPAERVRPDCQLGNLNDPALYRRDLRRGSASDRERPPVTGANGTLMAASHRGAGFPRAGAGKILPRPRRTVGGEKAGRPEPYKGARGREPPRGRFSGCSSPWCSSSLRIGANAPPFPGGSSVGRRGW